MPDRIERIAEIRGLGKLKAAPQKVSGGFLHSMYRVDTDRGTYAIKLLNPKITDRPDAAANFDRAESYERLLVERGMPVVPALEFSGRKRMDDGSGQYYVFDWVDGEKTDWHGITADQCAKIGKLLAGIHASAPKTRGDRPAPKLYDWSDYYEIGEIKAYRDLLERACDMYNRSVSLLDDTVCITDGDMDPKNVLWVYGEPVVIDLECLDLGNPVFDVYNLALQWSGTVTCDFDFGRFNALISAYNENSDIGHIDIGRLYGIGFSWLDWLSYNAKRALGIECADGSEKLLGKEQVLQTLKIIEYYYSLRERFLSL